MFYWLMKHVFIGPFLRLLYRPKARGFGNIPAEGPVILAANHISFLDSFFIPLLVKRPVVYLGKADYFDNPKTRWFVKSANVIPVRRDGGSASEAAIREGIRQLRQGKVVGIYPEGTRSPDGRLYRGKTGAARMALEVGCPVVPVAVFGTADIQPIDRKVPKLRGNVRVVFGKPLRFDRFRGQEKDRFVLRSITDEVMYEIMLLTGQEYVDEYAAKVKARMQQQPAAETATQRADAVTSAQPGQADAVITPEPAQAEAVIIPEPAQADAAAPPES